MDERLNVDRAFDAEPGTAAQLTPLVRRIVAGNPGPFTFTGTCTYIVGRGTVVVIDPGPDDPAHEAAILRALGTERISHVCVTHTHRDHSPAAARLAAAHGALVAGCPPFDAARCRAGAEVSHDLSYAPDIVLADGDALQGCGFTLRAVATPGHASNHTAFALDEEQALFSGDHVMAWSTSVVAPPDGSMGDYMRSLQTLIGRPETVYWPGHGSPVRVPQRHVRALISHRRQREAAVLARIAAGDGTVEAVADALYTNLDPRLLGAARLSVRAHVEDFVERGLVVEADGLLRFIS